MCAKSVVFDVSSPSDATGRRPEHERGVKPRRRSADSGGKSQSRHQSIVPRGNAVRGAIKARVSTGVQARGIPSSGRMAAVRAERGSIMVMSAVMIPVFLLLTALVDRRRQLVHAQAPAAGPRRRGARSPPASSTRRTGRPASRPPIAAASRVDGGRDRRCGATVRGRPRGVRLRRRRSCRRRLRNTEIANQANLDVVINSSDPNYTDDTDETGRWWLYPRWATRAPSTRPVTTSLSPRPLDGRARQGAQPALPRRHHRPPSRAESCRRGRVEVRPAISGTRFLPLAVPNNVITRVQVRYYDECRDPSHSGTPIAKRGSCCHSRPRTRVASRRWVAGRCGASPSGIRPHGRRSCPGLRPESAELRRLRAGLSPHRYRSAASQAATRLTSTRRAEPSCSRCGTRTASRGFPRSASGMTESADNQVRSATSA